MLTPRKETLLVLTIFLFVGSSALRLCSPILGINCPAHAHCANFIISFFCICDTGYTGDGETCTLVDCGTPSTPANSFYDPPCTNHSYGAQCPFTCNAPKILSGSGTRTCQANGAWTTAGSCIDNSSPVTPKGDISGNYTNGCKITKYNSDGQHLYQASCPQGIPTINYLGLYFESSFTFSTDTEYQSYGSQGGVNYVGATTTVASIWIGTKSQTWTKGTSAALVPVPRVPILSQEYQSCFFNNLVLPIKDYQRCAAGLDCYFRSDFPPNFGEYGMCMRTDCSTDACAAGSKYQRNGYCNAGTCQTYRTNGQSCGGFDGSGNAVHPMCDIFTSFCVSGVCQTDPCLTTNCKFGRICLFDGTNPATCAAVSVPGLSVPAVEAMLGEIVPDMPIPRIITTQSYDSFHTQSFDSFDTHAFNVSNRHLMMMPRSRAHNPRANRPILGLPPTCAPGCNCCTSPPYQCVSGSCQSPGGGSCGPLPC